MDNAGIKTWRERIGAGPDYPLHAPTDVERAMVAEIAELRAFVVLQDKQHGAGAPQTCRGSEKPQAQQDDRQIVVIGGQRMAKNALLELQHDAGRYRWLRDKADKMGGTAAPMVASLDAAGRMVSLLDGEELDAAVDVAMAKRVPARRTKLKRTGTDQ